MERFPNFDYYFFLEDDVELVDESVFAAHVALSRSTGIHHFSLFDHRGERRILSESQHGAHRIVHCLYGGAHFNFFTRDSLKTVGGWHPMFSQYRRFGHTEHSYRFPRAGLAPAPFNVVDDLADACIWHVPPVVTFVEGMTYDSDQIAAPERELMSQELRHVPVQTLGPYHFNNKPFGSTGRLSATLDVGERYPLLHGRALRRARSGYHLWRSAHGALPWRALAMFRAACNWPSNPALRHTVKVALTR